MGICFPLGAQGIFGETNQAYFFYLGMIPQKSMHRYKGNFRRFRLGIPVNACGNGGKGDFLRADPHRFFQGTPVGGGQYLPFLPLPATPYGPDGMNDPARGETISAGNFGFAGRASFKGAAFFQKPGTGGPMDRAVHTASSQETATGCVDDGVHFLGGNLADLWLREAQCQLLSGWHYRGLYGGN